MIMGPIRWEVMRFDALAGQQVYAILQARAAVFVVEQHCVYQDMDGLDLQSLHVCGWSRERELAAYARITPPGLRFGEPSIGRVLTVPAWRGAGLGRALMAQAIESVQTRYPQQAIRISAQCYLEAFYRQIGFRAVRGPYAEDGISHVEMLRDP